MAADIRGALRNLLGGALSRIPRTAATRNAVLVLAYTSVFYLAHRLAYQIRFDFNVPTELAHRERWGWAYELPLRLALLAMFGQFGGLLSYFSLPDMKRIVGATTSASAILLCLWYLPATFPMTPRGVLLLDWILSTGGLLAVRLALRMLREYYREGAGNRNGKGPAGRRRAAVLGAGDVGAALVRALQTRRGLGMEPVVSLDDDRRKWGCHVHGVPVVGAPERLAELAEKLRLDLAIVAMPSASAKRMRELLDLFRKLRLDHRTVPSTEQLATGEVEVSRLRRIDIEDLLGREPVRLEVESIRGIVRGKRIMVTGAGGSIGSELCRQVARHAPKKLLLIERAEGALFSIHRELQERGQRGVASPIVADVGDATRMRQIFSRERPQVIFHAAAHKHVPMMEMHPGEAVRNNSIATARLAELATEHEAERFVLISTDKAINPTSVMGASKRLAELYIQALFRENGGRTRFMAVRFGNVLGSSGSVVPIFREQIAAGGPVTVTHPEMRRYFMTIPEAVGLVLQSAAQGEGGEIFVLDMGKPVYISRLAEQMIALSGLRPGEDIEIKYVGLRPGEKLFEELFYDKEKHRPTRHPKIMRFMGDPPPYQELKAFLEELDSRLWNGDSGEIKRMLVRMVPEYEPYFGNGM